MTGPGLAPPLSVARRVLEVCLILGLCAAYGSMPTPAVNEAHYLAKAKHYWDANWCPGDQFLDSADAHSVFYWTFGWLTVWLPLPLVAWSGRFFTWAFFSWAWQGLSWTIAPQNWYSLISAGLLLFGVQRCHFGGEWLIGGIEAKGFAFGFVFWALTLMLRNSWNAAGLCLGLATSFHVLVGGWSMVAAVGAWYSCGAYRPAWRELLPGAAMAMLVSLPGLVPALRLNHGVPDSIVRDANAIYVFERLSHHLLFHRIVYSHVIPFLPLLRHLSLVVIWIVVGLWTPCRMGAGRLGQRPLRGFVGTALAIAVMGATLDQLLLGFPQLALAVMRYYWFRLSDVMMPAGAALIVMGAIVVWRRTAPATARQWMWAAAAIVLLNLTTNILQRVQDYRLGVAREVLGGADFGLAEHPKLFDSWRRTCEWISQNTDPRARFLTPRWQQTFKWYAGRSEVVTWKDIPQDARSISEWWDRLQYACPPVMSAGGIAALSDDEIRSLGIRYQFQYILVDKWLGQRKFGFVRCFPAETDSTQEDYEVYEIANPKESARVLDKFGSSDDAGSPSEADVE